MLSSLTQCVSSVVQEEDNVVFSHSVCYLLSRRKMMLSSLTQCVICCPGGR